MSIDVAGCKREVMAAKITLDGLPAHIVSRAARRPHIVSDDGTKQTDWTWFGAQKVVRERGGAFNVI